MDHRKRAARACDECRRLKEKCEGGAPCRRCSHFQRQCEFKGLVSRTREFRSYVPRERAARSDFQEQIERSKYMERILKRTIEGIRLDTKSLARLADALDADASDAKEIEGLVIDEEACTMNPISDTTTHFSGEFSYWNFSMRVKSHIEKQMEGLGSQPQSSDEVSDFPRAHQLRPGRAHLSAAISSCPPRQIADFLVRTFFKYAETHYFFVGQSWIFEKIDLLYRDPASFTQKGGEVVISILLMVFAIGTQYAHLESSAHDTAEPSSTTESGFAEEDIGTTFYQQAVRLLPEIIELSSLESVQACLLLGYYALPVDASGLGYIYINLAIRLAMQNGMHRKCKDGAFNPKMIETRNRVWWTAYLLERKISIFHGRPLSVLRSDVDASIPLHRPDLELGDSHASVARAEASIQLINFLEDLFNEVNVLRNSPKQQIPRVIKSLLACTTRLKSWWESLPEDVVTVRNHLPVDLRSKMHLRLEYCLVRMFIGRPFLLKRETSNAADISPMHSETSPGALQAMESGNQKYLASRNDLVDDCIKAATEALGICQDLKDSGEGLARASYIEYSSCRASLLVLIAYSIQNFSEQFRKLLYSGLGMIREMSAAGESARSEVSLIETLERALAHLHTEAQKSQRDKSMVQSGYNVSDYEAFKHWGTKFRGGIDISDMLASTSTSQIRPLLSSDQPPAHDQMGELDNPGESLYRDFDASMLGDFDSVIEMSIFGPENSSPSAAWPTWTETQVLEQFLTNSGFENQGVMNR
ncbi:fungal-specific transcription factor [Penicillium herquei]|nr:fungal-specific transcription factor [Penicillium herquei]